MSGTPFATPESTSLGWEMGGRVIVGPARYEAGRSGEGAVRDLSSSLVEVGVELGRMKTGTTPRLLHSSIRWEDLPVQEEDEPDAQFSYFGPPGSLPRIRCRITWTNQRTHDLGFSLHHRLIRRIRQWIHLGAAIAPLRKCLGRHKWRCPSDHCDQYSQCYEFFCVHF